MSSSFKDFEVYITRTGSRMHFLKTCRSLYRSYDVRKSSIQVAHQEGLTPCSICFPYGLSLIASSRNLVKSQEHIQERPNYFLNERQVVKFDSNSEVSTNSQLSSGKYVIQYDYSVHDEESKEDLNQIIPRINESCLVNSKSNLKEDSSNSFSIIPTDCIQKDKAFKLKESIDNAIPEMARKKRILIDELSLTEKEKDNHAVVNENCFCLNEKNEEEEKSEKEKAQPQISISSSRTMIIRGIDFTKDIDHLSKCDLIEIKQNEVVFFKVILKPQAQNGKCRLGFDIITFCEDDSIDEIESNSKRYDIKESTIIILCYDRRKELLLIKFKKEKESNWNSSIMKKMSFDKSSKMIRPVILFKEGEYSTPIIIAFKNSLR